VKVAVKLSPDSELILHESLFSYDAFNNIIVYDILLFCCSDPLSSYTKGRNWHAVLSSRKKIVGS